MKRINFSLVFLLFSFQLFSQQDSSVSVKKYTSGHDTIHIGNITIITNGEGGHTKAILSVSDGHNYKEPNKSNENKKKISTNWFVWDLGFAGYDDRTNYASAEAQAFLKNPGIINSSKGDYALKGSRISNFNLWFFMQRLNIAAGVLNLKYGFGIESNNYFFKNSITYVDDIKPYTLRGLPKQFTKNKLVANYLTVPVMLNINTNPSKHKTGLQFSAGISGGYLYGSRQKQKGADGTQKNKTDFNLERWKLSYIAELGIGPVKLYGSLAATPLHQYGLDQHPYTVGVRFSN
jgi:hypothetical protein